MLVALLLAVIGMVPGCSRAEPDQRPFDVPGQPAATALNAFAQQADITLLFSYDAVQGVQTRTLRGRFTVDEGLAHLLDGTPLRYLTARDGIYLVQRLEGPDVLADGTRPPDG